MNNFARHCDQAWFGWPCDAEIEELRKAWVFEPDPDRRREIGARIGIPITQEPEDRHAVTRKLGAFKTSMLQDVEAGRPIELDALVTVVQEIGRLTQVPTPCTDALLGLARLHARMRGLY